MIENSHQNSFSGCYGSGSNLRYWWWIWLGQDILMWLLLAVQTRLIILCVSVLVR